MKAQNATYSSYSETDCQGRGFFDGIKNGDLRSWKIGVLRVTSFLILLNVNYSLINLELECQDFMTEIQ